jgi:hypothetical protein
MLVEHSSTTLCHLNSHLKVEVKNLILKRLKDIFSSSFHRNLVGEELLVKKTLNSLIR